MEVGRENEALSFEGPKTRVQGPQKEKEPPKPKEEKGEASIYR